MKSLQLVPKLVALTLAIAPAFAQSAGNWSRFDNPSPQAGSSQPEAAPQISSSQPDSPMAQASPEPYPQAAPYPQAPPPAYGQNQNQNYPNGGPPPNGGPGYNNNAYSNNNGGYAQAPPPMHIPDTLNMPAGEYVTVRINNLLSSDRNQPGDAFTASLVEPLVIDGVVVAQRGQMVTGRVIETTKAGRVKGTSSMRIELTGITLVDGQQIPLKTSFMNRQGRTSNGRDANAIVGTTALGAIVGAAATGTGFGAGMGAIGGVVAGTVGVLVTRGRPTIITPESVMTFRVEQPVTISTVHSAGAFYSVAREDYNQGPGGPSFVANPYPYASAGYPVAYPGAYAYAPFYGAYFGGPAFYFRGGYRYYGRGGYYGFRGRR